MKVVVGLGNPGKKYAGTRHNVGFVLLDELYKRFSVDKPRRKFDAEVGDGLCGAERVLLVAPQTYMNASGRSVRQVVDFYQTPLSDLLVACDDLNLPLGRLRLRGSGSAGGQKGLENIIQQLGTQEFARLRLGIDPPPGSMDAADYVLGRFGKREAEEIDQSIQAAVCAVETWIEKGIEAAMNRFNGAGA